MLREDAQPSMRQRRLAERGLTIGYLEAFRLVASYVTLNRMLAGHEGSTEIVNVSGRHGMSSQRTAGRATEYEIG